MSIPRLLLLPFSIIILVPTVTFAKISIYTDSSGKVHISNQESTRNRAVEKQPENLAPKGSLNLRETSRAPEPQSPEVAGNGGRQSISGQEDMIDLIWAEPDRQAKMIVRPAAGQHKPHGGKSNSFSSSNAARKARYSAEHDNSIRIRQNEQGTLVITNLPEEEPKLTGVAALKKHPRPQVPDSAVAPEALPLAGQIMPASYSLKQNEYFSTALEEGPIRRGRDKHGVIRISNVTLGARKNRLAAVAAMPPNRSGVMPPLLTQRSLSPETAPASGNQLKTVMVQRDANGRVRIFTKEPERQILARGSQPALEYIDPALAPIVREAAATYQLPPSLILSVIRMESNFVPGAISSKGAMGLMQLMPGTAADLGVQDPFCPRENIMGGSRYLREMLNCFNGSVPLAVAAYNAGPNRVVAAGHQVPEIKETQQFVSRVLGLSCLLEKSPLLRLLK